MRLSAQATPKGIPSWWRRWSRPPRLRCQGDHKQSSGRRLGAKIPTRGADRTDGRAGGVAAAPQLTANGACTTTTGELLVSVGALSKMAKTTPIPDLRASPRNGGLAPSVQFTFVSD